MDEYETARVIFAHPLFSQSKEREQGAIESAEMWAQMPDNYIEEMLSQLSAKGDWWQWRFEYELAYELHKKGRTFPSTLAQRQTASQFIKKPNKNSGKHSTRDAHIAFVVAYLVKVFPEVSATRNDESCNESACDVVASIKNLGYDSVKKIWLAGKSEALYVAACVGKEFPLFSLPMR